MKKFNSFREFYPYYLEEHSKPATKLLHFIGTAISIGMLSRMVQTGDLIYFLYALLAGYGFAWVAHFFIEKNKPATFTYPFYSLIGDYKMFWEILSKKHEISFSTKTKDKS
jgi:hypothetical protein